MKLLNGTEVIIKSYKEENAEEIVNLIIRNFKEVNVKDYGEETIALLCATYDVNWFKGVVEFYRKKGYDYKNGKKELDEEQLYRLEKFRKKQQ